MFPMYEMQEKFKIKRKKQVQLSTHYPSFDYNLFQSEYIV